MRLVSGRCDQPAQFAGYREDLVGGHQARGRIAFGCPQPRLGIAGVLEACLGDEAAGAKRAGGQLGPSLEGYAIDRDTEKAPCTCSSSHNR